VCAPTDIAGGRLGLLGQQAVDRALCAGLSGFAARHFLI
jgi:hypothetical protein